jgi:hypothetical protein
MYTYFQGKPLSKLSSGQMPDRVVKIPAYTGVMLSQMPWGCPGADRCWIWLVHNDLRFDLDVESLKKT